MGGEEHGEGRLVRLYMGMKKERLKGRTGGERMRAFHVYVDGIQRRGIFTCIGASLLAKRGNEERRREILPLSYSCDVSPP